MNMNGCLNILWHFPFFGFLFAFFYALFGAILCCTVVLYPVGLGFFQIARFLLTPFSSALVTRKELDLVRPEERSTAAAAFSTVITILYFPFGLIAAAGALFAMIGEFLSIIGIPCGIVWFKALPAIFMPVDKICVPKAVADEIARIKAGDTVRRYKGETGEPETHSAERHFTEDPGETLPPMPEVRQYDDEKLHEIVSGAAMYRASLVEECRRELEIRSRSAEFTAQVRAMDNDKLHEVLASPQLYAEELIYACTLEQAERRRVWREEQAKEEEKLRLRREQEEKEAAERRAVLWKKNRPYLIAALAVLILAGAGIKYHNYRKEQVRLEQERIAAEERRIAEERRAEEQRIAEQKRAEAERIAAEKRRKEAERLAAERQQQAEAQRRADRERREAGYYKPGELYEKDGVKGVVFTANGTHGQYIRLKQGRFMSWSSANIEGKLPSMDEMKEIYRLRKTLNLTLKQAHGDCIEGSYWLSGRRNGIVWFCNMEATSWETHNCTEYDVRSKPYVKNALWIKSY